MAILIKNIQLIDGTGKSAIPADVLIKNEKISAIGQTIDYKADEIIDGRGAYLSPGFIDINNNQDRHLDIFFDPSQKHLLFQGITTIIGGQGGFSLAPLIYGSLQSLRPFADIKKINVDWHAFSEFLRIMEKKSLGVNFGSFIGVGTIYQALIGGLTARKLTPNESKIFISMIKNSLKEGAFGISIDFANHSISEISYFEFKKIADLAFRLKKICAVNLKNTKKDLIDSIKKLIHLAKESGAKFLINDFFPFVGFEKDYRNSIKLIEENSASADIHFNLYPYGESVNLIDEKILSEWPRFNGEEIIIVNAPGHDYLIGKSLKEFAQNRNLNFSQAFLKLMEITGLRAEISQKNINWRTAVETIAAGKALLASSSLPSTDYYQPFKKFLELAEKEKIMPLEAAIKKITSLPAQIIGLEKRGAVKNGYFADLTIFKDGEIREVMLAGKRVVKEGIFQNILAGKILK